MPVRPAIIPCLVYDDAPRAIDFLCAAFGFTRHAVHAEGDMVHNAQLMLGGQLVMLGSASRESLAQFAMAPLKPGGTAPMCVCVVLDDPDAHYARAVKAGVRIIRPPHDNDYGGRSYEAKDSEGIVWSFGSYDPFAES